MKLIILGVIVAAVLAISGLAAMALLGKGGPLAGVVPRLDSPPKVEFVDPTPVIVPLDGMALPVIVNGEIIRQVNIQVKLLVDRRKSPAISALAPKLYSAILKDLLIFLPIHMQDRDEVDKEAIKRRILITCERLIGPDLVKDVTFVAISYQ